VVRLERFGVDGIVTNVQIHQHEKICTRTRINLGRVFLSSDTIVIPACKLAWKASSKSPHSSLPSSRIRVSEKKRLITTKRHIDSRGQF
jgi:hypothetical protein